MQEQAPRSSPERPGKTMEAAPQDETQGAAKPPGGDEETTDALLTPKEDPEIVIGLIGPIGVDLEPVITAIKDALEGRYPVSEIRLSEEIAEFFSQDLSGAAHHVRTRKLMHLGTKLRQHTNHGDAAALLAIAEIKRMREEDLDGKYSRHAFILRSLKTPEEVHTLRNVYGNGFFAVSVYSSRERRVSALATRISSSRHGMAKSSRALAERLIEIDELEDNALGQDVQGAFPMADLFVYTHNAEEMRRQIRRFVHLVFAYRFFTPTGEEHGMQHARAAALRSSDMNRQVGAAIVNQHGDLLVIGCNDVPKAKGGFYWPEDDPDHRDFKMGRDSMSVHREEVLAEMLSRLQQEDLLKVEKTKISELVKALLTGDKKMVLKGAVGMNILEFGRSVHAEMAALTTAARLGVSVQGATLYCTTFPCHICARHIVASGIERVVYVEPYPKSKAKQLHGDAITVDPEAATTEAVTFEPFQGVSPGRYMELFAAGNDRRKTSDGRVPNWSMSTATPRFVRFLNTYKDLETAIAGKVIGHWRALRIDPSVPGEPGFEEVP